MASNKHIKQTPEERAEFLRARRRGFSGPLMFVVVIVAVIFVMSVFLRVSDVQVEGNVHYTDEEIIRAIDIEEGDNLFFFDRFAAIGRAYSKLPIWRRWPWSGGCPTGCSSPWRRARPWPIWSWATSSGPWTTAARSSARRRRVRPRQLIPIVGISPAR